MSRGKFEVREVGGIRKITVEHTTIPCDDESHQGHYLSPRGSGNCAACAHKWLSSLPFYRPYQYEDRFFKIEFGVANDIEWYKKIVKDIWDSEGEEWRGYTAEFFGPKRGEVEDPGDYQYWRIEDEQDPKQLIQLMRMRVCYEPQKESTPIFLEVHYKGLVTSAIRGMDSGIEIGSQELEHLRRVRNRLFHLGDSPALNLKGARRGRHKGSGYFASEESFLVALQDVLQRADRSLSESRALERLSHHQFWQRKPLSLTECQSRTKTLRNWLDRCHLSWDDAKAKYCPPAEMGDDFHRLS